MNERDKELADEAEAYADRDFKGEINWAEAYESKLIELVRADAMEVATRAANVSWSLVCKKMVELEREACAKMCEEMAYVDPKPHHYANAIRTVRARSQP